MGENGKYHMFRGKKAGLSIEVFCYALLQFWKPYNDKSDPSMSIDKLTNEPSSPGRVFLLSEDDVMNYMYQVETVIPELVFDEGKGYSQLYRQPQPIANDLDLQILKRIYGEN